MRIMIDRRVHGEIQEVMDYYRRNAGAKIATSLYKSSKGVRY